MEHTLNTKVVLQAEWIWFQMEESEMQQEQEQREE